MSLDFPTIEILVCSGAENFDAMDMPWVQRAEWQKGEIFSGLDFLALHRAMLEYMRNQFGHLLDPTDATVQCLLVSLPHWQRSHFGDSQGQRKSKFQVVVCVWSQ